MAANDVQVFEAEFHSVSKTIIYLPALAITQLLAQEIFYYYNPTPGSNRLMWSWVVFAVSIAAGLLLATVCAFVFVCCRIAAAWRMNILFVCFIVPVMIFEVSVQETFYYEFPGNYPDRTRLIAFIVATIISWPVCWVLCWLFCSWCDCIWKGCTVFYYARLPTDESPSSK